MLPAHAGQEQWQTSCATVTPRDSASKRSTTQSQLDQLGSYGLPYHAPTVTPSNRFDDATELASDNTQHAFASGQAQQSPVQPQFMSGLMSLHGITTPEEKLKREDKQKQYARELDEQVILTCMMQH